MASARHSGIAPQAVWMDPGTANVDLAVSKAVNSGFSCHLQLHGGKPASRAVGAQVCVLHSADAPRLPFQVLKDNSEFAEYADMLAVHSPLLSARYGWSPLKQMGVFSQA